MSSGTSALQCVSQRTVLDGITACTRRAQLRSFLSTWERTLLPVPPAAGKARAEPTQPTFRSTVQEPLPEPPLPPGCRRSPRHSPSTKQRKRRGSRAMAGSEGPGCRLAGSCRAIAPVLGARFALTEIKRVRTAPPAAQPRLLGNRSVTDIPLRHRSSTPPSVKHRARLIAQLGSAEGSERR